MLSINMLPQMNKQNGVAVNTDKTEYMKTPFSAISI
jgi:hypothetical protein